MSFWSVAMCKPQNEHIAKANLERQGYETYLPVYQVRIGKEIRKRILFPRYIFVRIELQWHSVSGTRGISRLIYGTNQQPASLSDSVIATMKAREDKKGYVSLPEPPKFEPGQKVRIVNNNLFGIYSGQLPHERHRILVELMGRMVPVDVADDDITAAAIQEPVK